MMENTHKKGHFRAKTQPPRRMPTTSDLTTPDAGKY